MIGFGWWFAYWWVILVEAVALLMVMGAVSVVAPRFVGSEPKNLGRLKASMWVTLILILVSYVGIFYGLGLLASSKTGWAGLQGLFLGAVVIVVVFSILQWLFSPFIINLVYRARPPSTRREFDIQRRLEELARRAGMRRIPKLRVVDTMMPNAFAYGSPIAGSYVAVTTGLLRIADDEEVEAVLGHELGHHKHRDVAWILALSIIPLAIYYLGRSLIYASFFSGQTSSRRRDEGGSGYLLLIGIGLVVLGFIFKLLVAHYNRLREYYADAYSTLTFAKGRQLQRALTKIYLRIREAPTTKGAGSMSLASTLFIVAPLVEVNGGFLVDTSVDPLVEAVKREKVNPVVEVFSTHPPVPKRLKFIDNLLRWGPIERG
ncbi:MAG: zinc metalloprotease HtpX [Desulfurococcales archaeon]|nr:zinc metalloprotease HtpX [Desulfurococcales archaeon]